MTPVREQRGHVVARTHDHFDHTRPRELKSLLFCSPVVVTRDGQVWSGHLGHIPVGDDHKARPRHGRPTEGESGAKVPSRTLRGTKLAQRVHQRLLISSWGTQREVCELRHRQVRRGVRVVGVRAGGHRRHRVTRLGNALHVDILGAPVLGRVPLLGQLVGASPACLRDGHAALALHRYRCRLCPFFDLRNGQLPLHRTEARRLSLAGAMRHQHGDNYGPNDGPTHTASIRPERAGHHSEGDLRDVAHALAAASAARKEPRRSPQAQPRDLSPVLESQSPTPLERSDFAAGNTPSPIGCGTRRAAGLDFGAPPPGGMARGPRGGAGSPIFPGGTRFLAAARFSPRRGGGGTDLAVLAAPGFSRGGW